MEYTRVCKRCGKTFTTCQSKAEFCCRKCKDLYRHEQERLESTRLLNRELNQARESFEKEKQKSKTFYTPAQASKYLGVSRSSIYNYMNSGVLPCLNLPGRTLIRREDIEKLFKKSNPKASVELNPDSYITFYQMCDEFHLSYNFVRETCHEYGLKPIVRNATKYYERDKVKEAFEHHRSLMSDSKEQRKKEYARRKQQRRSKDFIPSDYPHPDSWYSFFELMNKYHMDRNQVEQYARENSIKKMHINRYCFFESSRQRLFCNNCRDFTFILPRYTFASSKKIGFRTEVHPPNKGFFASNLKPGRSGRPSLLLSMNSDGRLFC